MSSAVSNGILLLTGASWTITLSSSQPNLKQFFESQIWAYDCKQLHEYSSAEESSPASWLFTHLVLAQSHGLSSDYTNGDNRNRLFRDNTCLHLHELRSLYTSYIRDRSLLAASLCLRTFHQHSAHLCSHTIICEPHADKVTADPG